MNIVKVKCRNTLSDISIMYNKNTPQKLSKRTVQRRLHEIGYHRRAVKKTTTISKQNRLKRRLFCRSHLHWSVNFDWSRVIFSDETQVVLGKNRKVFVWRKNDEKWKPCCLGIYSPNDPQTPQLSVMFWGCITSDYVGTCEARCTSTLVRPLQRST